MTAYGAMQLVQILRRPLHLRQNPFSVFKHPQACRRERNAPAMTFKQRVTQLNFQMPYYAT